MHLYLRLLFSFVLTCEPHHDTCCRRAFVWYLCYLWDTQKQRIAFDYAEQQLKQQLQQQQKQLQQREQSQRALSVVEEEELQRQLQVRLKQKASERLIEEVLAVVATDDKQKQKDKDRLHSVPFDPQAGVYLSMCVCIYVCVDLPCLYVTLLSAPCH